TGTGTTFSNSGLVRKTGGGGTSVFGSGFLAVVNNGAIETMSGMLSIEASNISSSVSDTGAYVAGSGATLRFVGGTRSLGPTSSITGAGTLYFGPGATNFTCGGVYNVSGQTIIDAATVYMDGPTTFGGVQII